jgi:tetratricopeptide (TPR) repeat protein
VNWQDVQTLRKARRFDEARVAAMEILARDPSDLRTRSEYEWVIFGYIKDLVAQVEETLEQRPVQARDLESLMQRMREYWTLKPQIPGMACSNILGQLAKVGPHLPKFPEIVRWISLEGLRPEDWKPNIFDNRTLPALAVSVARAMCKWVKAHPAATADQASAALVWADRAKSVADGDSALWLTWDMAIALRQIGDVPRAAELLASVIKAKRGEFWVWAEAGRLYMAEQPELALACLCRALECPAEPKFLVRTHRELAELLADQADFAQASRELAITIEIRQSQGWPPGREVEQLIAMGWYDPAASGAEEPAAFYANHSQAALALCFDVVEVQDATYLGLLMPQPPRDTRPDWKPKPRPGYATRDTRGFPSILMGPGMRKNNLDIGAPLRIVVGSQRGERRRIVVHVALRQDGADWDCVESKSVRGRLQRHPKGFGFVDDVFVAPVLLSTIGSAVDDVTLTAVHVHHPKEDRLGWQAVNLAAADDAQ